MRADSVGGHDHAELGDDRAAVLEEVSNLLRDFSQSIQEEAKDRKYRFHVKRLIKATVVGLILSTKTLTLSPTTTTLLCFSLSEMDQSRGGCCSCPRQYR